MLVRAVDEILGTHNDSTPPSLLRPGVEVRLQRGRLHRRIQRRSETLPLSRQQHPDPMDPGTSSRHQQLTSGKDTRSARCAERRTDRKSTRLNSSHLGISYAVFCLKKK